MLVLLLDHGPDVAIRIQGKSAIEWASLSRRSIYELLKQKLEPAAVGFLLEDLMDSASRGSHALAAYIAQ